MKYSERDIYILKSAVDSKWFLKLKYLNRPLLLKGVQPKLSSLLGQKELFLKEKIRNPVFIYNLNYENITETIQKLYLLQEEVLQYESDLSIKNIYVKKINELILEQDILLASHENNWTNFKKFNLSKFDSFDLYCIDLQRERVKSNFANQKNEINVTSAQIKRAKNSLLNEVISAYNFSIKEDVFIEGLEILRRWSVILRNLNFNWNIELSKRYSSITVVNKLETVFIPCNVRMSELKCFAMFAHEVGVHVYKREQGKKNRLQLLSIGAPNSKKSEEGIATVVEQLVKNQYTTYFGHDKYLALCLASGVLDGKERDFRDTYEYIHKVYSSRHTKKYDDCKACKMAKDRAWNTCVRIFRGADPSMPGVCFLQDKLYLEGNVQVWNAIKDESVLLKRIYAGKYDPFNEEHVALLNKYY